MVTEPPLVLTTNKKRRSEKIGLVLVDPMSYDNLGLYDKCLAESLVGCRVSFCCNTKLQFSSLSNVDVKRFYDYSDCAAIGKIIYYLWGHLKLIIHVLAERPEIIHFQWLKVPFLDLIFLRLLKNISRAKIVITAHNVLPHDSGQKYCCIFRKIYKFVDGIIVHAADTRQEIVNRFTVSSQKIAVIPHGMLNHSSSGKTIQRMPGKLLDFLANKKIVFGTIGFLTPYKGIDLLLRAWLEEPLLRDSPDYGLVLAGRDRMGLEQLGLPKNVLLLNQYLSDSELEHVVSNIDVFVLPYRQISQSGVLLTILTMKKPVIVSPVGGLTQPFEIGNFGWVLENCSSEAIRKALLDAVSRKDVLELENLERKWDELFEFYSWKNIGVRTYEFYSQILKDPI